MSVGPPTGSIIQGIQASASEHRLPLEQLTAKEVADRWPGYRIPEGYTGLFEEEAGFLMVEKAVRVHIEQAQQAGATFLSDQAVVDWSIDGANVLVRTETDQFSAARLIITAGSWSADLLGKLGFEHQEKSKTEKWNKFEAILQILKNKVNEGKIRHIGISNETSWGLSKFIEVSKLHELPGVISIQNPYNFLNRTFEIGLAEISIRDQISLLGYSPLAGGYLTGKYRNGQFPKKSRMSLYLEYYPRYRKPNAEEAIEKYWKISKEYNLDFAQMAIKFCEIQKFLGSVIIGATSMEQLKINIESVSVNLTKEILNKINNVQIKYPNPCP